MVQVNGKMRGKVRVAIADAKHKEAAALSVMKSEMRGKLPADDSEYRVIHVSKGGRFLLNFVTKKK